jgi:hypothetical protein
MRIADCQQPAVQCRWEHSGHIRRVRSARGAASCRPAMHRPRRAPAMGTNDQAPGEMGAFEALAAASKSASAATAAAFAIGSLGDLSGFNHRLFVMRRLFLMRLPLARIATLRVLDNLEGVD